MDDPEKEGSSVGAQVRCRGRVACHASRPKIVGGLRKDFQLHHPQGGEDRSIVARNN